MCQVLDAVAFAKKMQEYWWYVEAFCKYHQRKNLVQIAGENRSV